MNLRQNWEVSHSIAKKTVALCYQKAGGKVTHSDPKIVWARKCLHPIQPPKSLQGDAKLILGILPKMAQLWTSNTPNLKENPLTPLPYPFPNHNCQT